MANTKLKRSSLLRVMMFLSLLAAWCTGDMSSPSEQSPIAAPRAERPTPDWKMEKTREGERWYHAKLGSSFRMVRTGCFRLFHRFSDERLRHHLLYLNAFYGQVYPRYFPHAPARPIAIVFFETRELFRKKTGMDCYGFYQPSEKTLYTYDRSGHGTLWHELIHAFVDANVRGPVQEWFSEGFASFYEMAFLHNGKVVEGYTNWRMPRLKKSLEDGSFVPLKKFMLETAMGPGPGYAEARFLFCHLWMRNRMTPFVKTYLFELGPRYRGRELGTKAVSAMESLLGADIAAIEKEYRWLARKYGRNEKLKTINR